MDFNGTCCVFQPFDKGAFDKRYEDIIVPAIRDAGLNPYRVDRDDGVIIPMDTLHDAIKNASLCLADISNNNPNVMYELGFAIAAVKDVILISSDQLDKFPFDIQHRVIISYRADSTRDFEELKNSITNKIKALLKRQAAKQEILSVSVSPVKNTQGLQPNEISALAFTMANMDHPDDAVNTDNIKKDMERAGYTRLASQLALTRLTHMNFVEPATVEDFRGDVYMAYKVLPLGERWLLDNQDKLEMRIADIPDEIPF